MEPDYKFNERQILDEILQHINKTYKSHYAKAKKFQTFESIHDSGHGLGFALGNVKKYIDRYGQKNGYNREDLLKSAHYIILALYDQNMRKIENDNT